jgi:phage portal protein BeeE
LVKLRFWSRSLRETTEETDALEPQIAAWWDEFISGTTFSPRMTDFVWVADRCIQLNAQQIASMPLKFVPGSPSIQEPAWLSMPDPVWYPNGIADIVQAAIDDYYRQGDFFLYVTDDYATGFPSAWTLINAAAMSVNYNERTGRRVYEVGGVTLDPRRVVQVSRNPRSGKLRGTSALKSYASIMDALGSASTASSTLATTLPLAVLKSERKLTEAQADALLAQWREKATGRRPGEPAVLDPNLSLEGSNLGFSATDLQLIESQEFNARVLASACGVPVFLLNLVLQGGLTYQNPAMLGEFWWRTELHSTSARVARALTSQMLPRGSSVYFDPSHLTMPLDDQTNVEESPAVNASPSQNGSAALAELRPLTTLGGIS